MTEIVIEIACMDCGVIICDKFKIIFKSYYGKELQKQIKDICDPKKTIRKRTS